MPSSASVEGILHGDDNQRLNYLVQVFAKYQMTGKRYETKTWHAYFRRIAINPVVFYQHNHALFYEDNQSDKDNFQIHEPTYIHGDLHIGQFHYYFDDTTNERIFQIRQHTKKIAPFTWDLKRLATNLVLIGYYQGFSDIEIIEILKAFIQQYINRVKEIKKINFFRQNSNEENQIHQTKSYLLQGQCSVIDSIPVQQEMHEIDWKELNSVASWIILAEQLAITVADLHCQSTISVLPTEKIVEKNPDYSLRIIQAALSSSDQQYELIQEICYFAMNYAEIAEHDHRLFFKCFRNETIFNGILMGNHRQMPRSLVSARSLSILIVGGGIGGLATALNFAQAGIRVRLFEKNSEFSEVGAGMQLAPNCSRVLDHLGILKQVQANAVFPKQIVWMDALSGQRLGCIDLGPKFIETFKYPYIVVHRADLLNALYQACFADPLVTLETNRFVVSVDERPKSIMVECADGTRYDCNMVVAADGLWSSLRKFVHDDGAPLSVGYVTYRGTIDISQVSKEAGLENVQFWIGPDMHLVQYPIRRGELFNQAAIFKSKRVPDDTDEWGTREELNQHFGIGCEHVKNALKLIQSNIRWPVYDRNPLSKWSHGHLVLLGDAAHPMLQYAGQGAAQALEDADALVSAYKKYGSLNLDAAFREYERKRIPRSSKIVQFARDIGNFAHCGGVAKIARDATLKAHDMNDYEILNWLYAAEQKDSE
ncbi:unnamed protein product [Rotaria socialis]|uniref:FAD-binding domain-containing protein n=2 Tax=Rotaria socialis TaxID=392032 RepID=A0A818LJ52_9BILA|nr:unnamed protein product [Rotaria socialis]CAF4464438.1 unnamed protein product [Rotaria socialis]